MMAAVTDGTRQMAALLVERAAKVNPARPDFYVNDRRADLLAQRLKAIPLSIEREARSLQRKRFVLGRHHDGAEIAQR